MSEGPLDKGLDIFKELVWDTLVEKAVTAQLTSLIGASLAGGPLGAFLGWILMKFANSLYGYISTMANLKAIAFKNEEAQEAYDRASVKLQIIYDQAGLDSEEYKNARVENKKRLKDLVQFDVARKP